MKVKRLYNLEPHEVSLVARGAIGKKFLVYKRKGESMSSEKARQKALEAIGKGLPKDKSDRIAAAAKKLISKRDGEAVGKEMSEEAQAALTAATRILSQYSDEISPSDLSSMLTAGGVEQSEDAGEAADKADDETESEAEKADTGASAESSDENDDSESTEKAEEEESSTEKSNGSGNVSKSSEAKTETSPELAAVFKAHKELVAKNAQLEKDLRIEQGHRKSREWITKAGAYRNLSVPADKLGDLLMRAHDADGKLGAELEGVFKQLHEQSHVAKRGLFREVGSSATADANGDDPVAKANAAIDSLVQKGGDKSREKIAAEFYRSREGRELYAQLRQQQKGL